MRINIRKALITDVETLYRIERECFTSEALSKEQILSLLRDTKSTALIAQTNGETAGFIIGKTYAKQGELIGHVITIDVAMKYRRKGVGKRLLSALEKTFLERGVKVCYLEVRADNVSALNLYRKEDYAEVGKLEGYYGNTHGILLKKQLKTS